MWATRIVPNKKAADERIIEVIIRELKGKSDAVDMTLVNKVITIEAQYLREDPV